VELALCRLGGGCVAACLGRTQLREQARQMQIDYHLLRTDEPVEKALGIYLTARQSRMK